MIIISSTMMVTSMIIIISITMVISVIFRTELRVPYIPARALLARACLLISSPSSLSLSSSSSSLPLWKDVTCINISGVWGFHLREGVVVPHQNKGRYILVQRHYHLDQNHPSVICCHCCLLQPSGALKLKRAWRDWEKVFFGRALPSLTPTAHQSPMNGASFRQLCQRWSSSRSTLYMNRITNFWWYNMDPSPSLPLCCNKCWLETSISWSWMADLYCFDPQTNRHDWSNCLWAHPQAHSLHYHHDGHQGTVHCSVGVSPYLFLLRLYFGQTQHHHHHCCCCCYQASPLSPLPPPTTATPPQSWSWSRCCKWGIWLATSGWPTQSYN